MPLYIGVSSILMGARNGSQVKRNLGALKVILSQETIQALEDATDEIKSKMGTNLDPYESIATNRIK